MRNKGSVELARIADQLATRTEIARHVRVTRQTIGLWIAGISVPLSFEARYLLWTNYRISVQAWDELPGEPPRRDCLAGHIPAVDAGTLSSCRGENENLGA